MLQTRSAKRTAAAAVKIATDIVDEGAHHAGGGARRGSSRPTSTSSCATSSIPRRGPTATRIAKGLNASPGAAVGRAVFDADVAVDWVGRGERVVLVRIETSPDDFHGMAVAQGILTARGGATAPRRRRRPPDRQAVRRRLSRAVVDYATATASANGVTLRRGRLDQPRRLDRRGLPRRAADRLRPVRGPARAPDASSAGPTRSAGCRSGPTPTSPRRPPMARRYGAQGIGLCRTEHMFREGERLEIVRGAILVAHASRRGPRRRPRPAARCRADESEAVTASTRRWASSRSSSRATSRASSGRWTACRSSSG